MSDASAARRRGLSRLAGLKAPAATAFLAPAIAPWWRLMLALTAAGFALPFVVGSLGLTEVFFFTDDLPVALLMIALAQLLYLATPAWAPVRSFAPDWRAAGLLALGVVAVCWAGTFLAYDGFALSIDEFLARFDARILATGRLAAPIAEAWRPYATALQPKFVTPMGGTAFWASPYLPVNAAFLALGLKLGLESLIPPLWAGISVLATFGAARRLWPETRSTAWVAAVLLATSSQLLVTAMTPYAMSAHLALNMVWLWLVTRGGRLGHGLAPGAAFLATGLHQMVFHPLFAAPFVLEMWLARRWRVALWHTATYAAICLFWLVYPSLLQHAYAGAGVAASAAGDYGTASQALGLIRGLRPAQALGEMVENLVRFATWQSLLTLPLALVAFWPAVRAGGTLRALALGPLLAVAAMFVLMPFQGHGWGYRYLHGYLGAFALLAAVGWTRIAAGTGEDARKAVFAAAAAASLIVLLPIQAWQAWRTEHPYAVAEGMIERAPADLVIVDPRVYFGIDLVRNAPFLDKRPQVLWPAAAPPPGLAELCRGRRVTWFGPDEARLAGVTQTARLDARQAASVQAWRSRCPATPEARP